MSSENKAGTQRNARKASVGIFLDLMEQLDAVNVFINNASNFVDLVASEVYNVEATRVKDQKEEYERILQEYDRLCHLKKMWTGRASDVDVEIDEMLRVLEEVRKCLKPSMEAADDKAADSAWNNECVSPSN